MSPAGLPITTGAAVSAPADNPLLQSWEHPVRTAAVRPHPAGALSAGLRPRDGRARGRDRGDRRLPRTGRFREHDRGAGAQRQAPDPDRPGVRQSDVERDKRGARRDRPRLRAAPRRAPYPHHARRGAVRPRRCAVPAIAIRSDWRRTSAVCSNAITCALCGPGRCSVRSRRRAWRRSPSGSRRCTRCSARMSCTTRTTGASCSTKPTSTGCRNSPAPPLPLRRSSAVSPANT